MTSVGSIRADVIRRALTSGFLLALAAVACSSPTPPGAEFGEGVRFLDAVADSQDLVGLAPSIAVGEDGTPYVASFGFPDEVEAGQIPVARPIGAPFLPAVLLTSVSPEGVFTRGAVAQDEPEAEPAGIEPPFRPAKVEGFGDILTPENANGTDVAVGASGVHVVWTAGNTIWHTVSVAGEDTVLSTVFELDLTIAQAGPLGRPSIALDSTGSPWVAFGVNDGDQVAISVARPEGDTWIVEEVAGAGRCNGCPPPLPTAIVAPGDVPIVAYGDPVDGSVHAATFDGARWTDGVVESGADGSGMSATTSGEDAMLAYYSGAGEVRLATWSGGAWTSSGVVEATDPTDVTGVDAATTGVGVAEDGTIYLTWQDEEGVQLAAGDGASFTPVESTGTDGGITPTLAVTPEGTVTMAWYDPTGGALRMGFYGDLGEIAIAQPSPAPTVSIAAPPIECGGKRADLQITGSTVGADNFFDKDCLVGPANEAFVVEFVNEGGTHNFEVLDQAGGTKIDGTELAAGPYTEELPLELEAADYYFQCLAHPTTMFGTLAVVPGAK